MKMHTMSPAVGANTKGKRLGRGTGSGLGKTSGKGHKGQWARSGGGVRPGFEGGQNPLHRRLPKIGFKNRDKKVFNIINVSDLEIFSDGTVVTLEVLLEKGIVRKAEPYGLKVLGNGELTKNLTVKAKKFSAGAEAAITKAGGKVEVI